MEILFLRFGEKYARTKIESLREFDNKVDWDNQLIGIKGSRGVGKTTLVLQHIKKNFKADESVLYASLDHLYFQEHTLYSTAEAFHKKGGKLLVLDEVHRYANWSVEMKNIYDDFPDLKVIFTGSSLLQITKAKSDLSRRAVMYDMPGLSFREFLKFETGLHFDAVSLDDLVANHRQIALEIIAKVKPLAYFSHYLQHGYYPFYLENKRAFHQKLGEVLQMVLDVDIPQYEQIQISNIPAIKRLLQIISGSVPFKPNYNTISGRSGISINTVKNYIGYLSEAQLLLQLRTASNSLTTIGKPEKIYLHNPNLMYTMVGNQAYIGNIRETFFYNQVSYVAEVNASPQADFLVNEQFTFEIGGKNKKQKQIENLPNSFIVKDDIEVGFENVIPLWLFGMMY